MSKQCNVEGCSRLNWAKGMCLMHYKRKWRHGDTNLARREMGSGTKTQHGYISIEHNEKAKYEHILLAEKALGKPLPKGAIVHHMNRNGQDNHTPFNLIICPDTAYHQLLHQRANMLGYSPYCRPEFSNGR